MENFSKNGDMLTCFICYTIEKRTNVRIQNKKTWHDKRRFWESYEIIIVLPAKTTIRSERIARRNGFGKERVG